MKSTNKDGQERKRTSGPIRDKDRTRERLISAVGKVIKKKGYQALNGPNIALESGLNKSLIWSYFGGVDNLVEEYIDRRDFWRFTNKNIFNKLLDEGESVGPETLSELLNSQFETYLSDKIKQRLLHWELGEQNTIMRKIADKREEMGDVLFKGIERQFTNKKIDIRATMALLISSVYYLTLHAKNNGSTFCGIDINDEVGKKRVQDAMYDILVLVFSRER